MTADGDAMVSVLITCHLCPWVATQHFTRTEDGRMPDDLVYELEKGGSVLWDWEAHEERHKETR
jgi:hypothetical protein